MHYIDLLNLDATFENVPSTHIKDRRKEIRDPSFDTHLCLYARPKQTYQSDSKQMFALSIFCIYKYKKRKKIFGHLMTQV